MKTCRREDFFDFDGWRYLNCAFMGPMPRVAAAAVEEGMNLEVCPNRVDDRLFFELPDQVRGLAAELIGATPEEVAIGTSATHGLNLAAAGLPLGPGDEVLMPAGEFPSNVFPWQYHGSRRGYAVRCIETQGAFPEVADFERAASPATRAVAVAFVSYSTGYRMDLDGLARLCQERDWFLVVDACQAAGSIPFSVAELRPDILATGCYKWLLGPYGTGFTYVREDRIEEMEVPVVNWFGLEGAEHFNALSEQRMAFAKGARRFDAPETAAFLNLHALRRSLQYVMDVGVETVERHHRALLDRLAAGLPGGFSLARDPRPERQSGIVFLSSPDGETTQAAFRRMMDAKIHVSLREDRIRVSPNLYNDQDDIDRLLDCL